MQGRVASGRVSSDRFRGGRRSVARTAAGTRARQGSAAHRAAIETSTALTRRAQRPHSSLLKLTQALEPRPGARRRHKGPKKSSDKKAAPKPVHKWPSSSRPPRAAPSSTRCGPTRSTRPRATRTARSTVASATRGASAARGTGTRRCAICARRRTAAARHFPRPRPARRRAG